MSDILPRIEHPHDLKKLSLDELQILAGEIRERIMDTVDRNGGHLASNLGSVELTLALHRVFDLPQDRLVWDTSQNKTVIVLSDSGTAITAAPTLGVPPKPVTWQNSR